MSLISDYQPKVKIIITKTTPINIAEQHRIKNYEELPHED